MDTLSIIFIAIGLSMDSFAVSIANGLTIRDLNAKKKFIISFMMTIFHALMISIGWFAGIGIEKYIKDFDHWVAFILLLFIGLKMIYESIKNKDNEKKMEFNISVILGQSFATSIDALAVGISFAFLSLSIFAPVLIIGFVIFVFSLIGLQLGKIVGKRIRKGVEILGGLVLIGIGFKILIEHLFF